MTEQLFFLQNMGLALLLGTLIGLERERTRHKEDVHEFGGIRTMGLISTLGYLIYSLFPGSVLFPVLTGGFLALLVASYIMSSYQGHNSGATTEMAGFFAYLIGILMAMGESLYATVVTLVVLLLLYFKKPLHHLAHTLEKEELYDTLKFVAIVFVILPLLPNQHFGPLDVLNPYEIWLVVVLISSISFASYLAIKFLGPKKGIGAGGFLGGLISSTAVSMSFSQLSRKAPRVVNPFVFGILVACSAMFFRVLLTVSILNRELLSLLYVPMIAMGIAGFSLAAYYWFKKSGQPLKSFTEKDLNLKSPFQLRSAIQFGVLFAALLFVSKFAADYFGAQGVLLTAFLSGVFDVDAITVSMANLSEAGEITTTTGALAIMVAATMNTISKAFIVFFFGSKSVGWRSFLALVGVIVVGFAALLISVRLGYGFTSL